MIIKFSCNWDTSENITKRFINNFIDKNNYDNKIEFTFNNDYDLHIVFNYCNELTDFSKTIVFIQEPSWSSHIKIDFLKKCKKVFFHDKSLLPELNNIFETPIIMFNHINSNSLYDILNKEIIKNKKISFITSSFKGNDNYNFRYNLVNKILETNLPIDIYGHSWDNIKDDRFKGEINDKKDGLINYEFSIAIENSSEKNYLSEKFNDCLICKTVPIYYGCPNINEIYKNKSYIEINNSLENTIKLLDNIIIGDIKYNDFILYLNESIKENNEKYNLYNFIKNKINNLIYE